MARELWLLETCRRLAVEFPAVLTVYATLQQTPPDNSGETQLATKEISVIDATYDQAMEQVLAAVPAGWRLLHIRKVERGQPSPDLADAVNDPREGGRPAEHSASPPTDQAEIGADSGPMAQAPESL